MKVSCSNSNTGGAANKKQKTTNGDDLALLKKISSGDPDRAFRVLSDYHNRLQNVDPRFWLLMDGKDSLAEVFEPEYLPMRCSP